MKVDPDKERERQEAMLEAKKHFRANKKSRLEVVARMKEAGKKFTRKLNPLQESGELLAAPGGGE